ncbi:T9SS type A sorting domain-containing protein [Winogradskyella aurantiaca]|uniref:T9SS type A sorting domain-containing protein n=1 Tax=Winogradskyella aurantiaca TaxID=2219558 RepID=UPI0013009A55|nr:T9SS type A sorting domain-containing protein [Winogradskyella aurantiaca]
MKKNYPIKINSLTNKVVAFLCVFTLALVSTAEAQCTASAGALTADASPVAIANGGATISASAVIGPTVPADYEVNYLLTFGSELVIEQIGSAASFTVPDTGNYRIHTLVAETSDASSPDYLDLSAIELGVTNAGDVFVDIIVSGICASLDGGGAPITVECTADAGTLTANADTVNIANGGVTIGASQNGDRVVPSGYTVTYVLTSGNNLIIEDASATPSFDVEDTGLYTIHTLVAQTTDAGDANYLDLGIIDFGTTPASAVIQIVIDNDVCASLDVTGAPINVVCSADAGTLTADASPVAIGNGGATITATQNAGPVVPAGYTVTYVLTSGNNLIIEAVNTSPFFIVDAPGLYTIHTLVAQTSDANDPNFLDLSIVDFGVTPATAVLQVVADNDLCAALDVAGAPIIVDCEANAGTLTADATPVGIANGGVTISATQNAAPVVPSGYTVTYVLTSGNNLIIEDARSTPSFDVDDTGLYTIHTLVAQTTNAADANYLDLSVIDFGVTPASAVIQIVVDNNLCAALDVTGAQIIVDCEADAGTLTANADTVAIANGGVTISATEGIAPVVPTGYTVTYVLTSGNNLIIEDAGSTPNFDVPDTGLYTIHTLVAQTTDAGDANYLDLGVIDFGTTPATAVLQIVADNDICASLDVTGAPINVLCSADAGTLVANATPVELSGATVSISASYDTAPVVPTGYSVVSVLTSGNDLIIEAVNSSPFFTVDAPGLYTIHTLVAQTTDAGDANYLDLSVIDFGVTPAAAVLNIVISNGLCAALDVTGAPIEVTDGSLSIEENELFNSVKLIKNPIQDELVLSNSRNVFINTLGIYDMTGRLVKEVAVDSNQSEVSTDVSTLSNGNYIMILNSEFGKLTLRWIKSR